MATLSKLSDKCKKCPHVDDCENKRMVACALAEMPKSNALDIVASNTPSNYIPTSRKHTPITINMGECGGIQTSLEELHEQFKRDLEKELYKGCNYGY